MRAFYLLGSGKPHGRSNSEALARYLHGRLALEEPRAGGADFASADFASADFASIDAKLTLHSAVHAQRLLDGVAACDLFVLASPIYVDALPYVVVHALEIVSRARAEAGSPCRFVALLNCGFPEALHCELGLRMARAFARTAHLEWAGGLALGGGESLAARPLERAGGVARFARQAIELAAGSLARGESIPDAAVALMAKPAIPGFMVRLIGAWGWKRAADKFGTAADLGARPFEKS